MLVGKVVTRELVLRLVRLVGVRLTAQQAAKWASFLSPEGTKSNIIEYVVIATALGAILVTLITPLVADKLGRRVTYFLLCVLALASAFVFFQTNHSYTGSGMPVWLMISAFLLGGLTASFYGFFPLYFPELFPTSVRATGQGFCFNFGRLIAAVGSLQPVPSLCSRALHRCSKAATAEPFRTRPANTRGAPAPVCVKPGAARLAGQALPGPTAPSLRHRRCHAGRACLLMRSQPTLRQAEVVGPGLAGLLVKLLGAPVRWPSVEAAADYLWSISQGFGPHTREQWLALTRPMLKPDGDGYKPHYDPAIAVPFRALTPELAARGEALTWAAYDAIACPTLLLRGAESDLLARETAQAMTQRGPKAALREFAGVGHAPTLVADDQVRTVREFLLS